MGAVISTSWTVATVVWTCTIRWGMSVACACSLCCIPQVSVKWTDVTQPGLVPLFARLGLGVIRGTDDPFIFSGLRTCPPFGLASREVVILLPDLLQKLHTGYLLQPSRCLGPLQCVQQMQAICPDLLG